jgi:hypothetical protein
MPSFYLQDISRGCLLYATDLGTTNAFVVLLKIDDEKEKPSQQSIGASIVV